ncbi:MAG: prepilin-type N-terminal cleavage/methylation domain-containing protein [Planctomycetaceae bacterium]|jgi:prepilin-type N-terminal cleavage/methylation domain-containing protein|nr:prepilin-type N-terminal cleavage/methylation domain-containing protein [Planctomycetaceae bacterium]
MKSANYRTKIKVRNFPTFSALRSPLSATYRAFTLIELLVVMSIMVLLVAMSVPMLKPMFESQKTKNAAQTVAAALQRVRFKAMEEQAACGIQFDRFTEGDANNVSLRMRLLKSGNAYLNPPDVRARVENNVINFYEYDSVSGKWNNPTTPQDIQKITDASSIQFGRQGRFYSKTDLTLDLPFIGLNLPENNDADAMEFKVLQSPRASLSPPVVLPRGTVIDLAFSSAPSVSNEERFNNKDPTKTKGVKIVFTPAGYLDKEFYIDDTRYELYNGLIYFCIGEWERGLDPADDGKNNIETMTNFWVTLNPKTGQVRITEMAPASNNTDVQGARKFAAEHFGISE